MTTPIDCRAYYIDNNSHYIWKSSCESCRSPGDTGSGFTVSKYFINRSESETEQNPNEFAANPCHDRDVGGLKVAVATGNDVRTSGHARRRTRLRRVMGRLESFIREVKATVHMKAAARDFRDIIVHADVITDNHIHRQTTSGLTDADNNAATVLQNNTSVSGYHDHTHLKSSAVATVRDIDLPRARNRHCKWAYFATFEAQNDRSVNQNKHLFPGTMENGAMTISNRLADGNNKGREYNNNFADHQQQTRRNTISGKFTSAENRIRPCRMATEIAQTKTAKWFESGSVASNVYPKPEVVFTKAPPREEEIPTTGSDQSTYSGIYERDLEDILESVAAVHCRQRRNRVPSEYFRQHTDKFSFRLAWPKSSEMQSYRSSSDSCSERSSDSDSEADRKCICEEEELETDEEETAAINRASFYRRLSRFLVGGSWQPEMAAIEP